MKIAYRSIRPLADIVSGGELELKGILTSALLNFQYMDSATAGWSSNYTLLLNGSTLDDVNLEDIIVKLNNSISMIPVGPDGMPGEPIPRHPEFRFSLTSAGELQLTAPDEAVLIHKPFDRTVNSYDLFGNTQNLATLIGEFVKDDVHGFNNTITEDFGSFTAERSTVVMAFDSFINPIQQECFFIHDAITGDLIHGVEWDAVNGFDLVSLAASLNTALVELGYGLTVEAILDYREEGDPDTQYSVLVFTSTDSVDRVYRFTCAPSTWFLTNYSGNDYHDIYNVANLSTIILAKAEVPPVVESPVVETPAVKFVNTVASDRRVKLVPKTPDASIANLKGGELEMVELEAGALGFCLAGNPCYGSTPAVALDLNTTDTFNAIIAGEERSNLTYEQLKAFLTSNGLSVVDTSPVIKCVPTDLSLTMPREITMGANDTVYLTVMMEGEITINQTIQDKDGQDVQLPPGMAQIAVQNSEFNSNPNYLLRQLFFYSGFDLARQLNADRAFDFTYDDGSGNSGYNDDYEDSGQSAVMGITGKSVEDAPFGPDYDVIKNATTLKFIPTPPQYIFADNYIDFVSHVMLADGEESVEVHSCVAVYSTAS